MNAPRKQDPKTVLLTLEQLALTGNQWAPRLDAAGFREGVEALGLNLTTCAGPLGLLPRQVRRYANGERTRIPRSLEILIAQLRAIRGV